MVNLTNVMGDFDARNVEIKSRELLPEGEYMATISSVELKESKKGGNFLQFDFTIQGSSHDGAILKSFLNVINQSKEAERIAKEQYAKICLAVDLPTPKDTNDFIGKRLKIKVTVKSGEGTYIDKFGTEKPSQAQNQVVDYYHINTTSAPPVQAQEQAQTQAEQTTKARAWA